MTSWEQILYDEAGEDYYRALIENLEEKANSTRIVPPSGQEFKALELTPFLRVKIVIIGQDPYYQPGLANGLAFSVNEGIQVPSSLKNIFVELERDLGIIVDKTNGDLTHWARNGVLLLNAILTTEEGKAEAHQGIGWERLTDRLIEALSSRGDVVFMLWGKKAQEKEHLIDVENNLILKAPHPSPNAQGFVGCKHFSRANRWLLKQGIMPVDWGL